MIYKGAIKTGIEEKDSGGKEGGVKRQEEIINVSKKSIRLEACPLEECVILLQPYNIQCCQGRLHSVDSIYSSSIAYMTASLILQQ